MKKIKASIKDQTLTIEQSVINVAGSINAYALEIAYDAEWDEMDTKIVTFTHGPIRLGIQDDGSEDGVVIPHEVLTFPGVVTVGVVGYKDSTAKLTTTGLYKRNTFVVLPQALGLADALTPTPDIYVKLVNKLEELQGDYDNLSDEMGSLSDLETQNKDNLVAAINEVLNSGGGSGTVKSVNHKDPDADGNVALTYTDIPGRPSLATVATTGNYNDLTNKPTIPNVNDATLTIQKNGTDIATFTANSATNQTANIAVPTTASDIGAEPTIDSEHKLASDLVDDTDQTNKFATADDLSKLAGIESGAEVNDIDSISVNGTAVTPDEHKNVDITVPTYTAGANVQISAQNEISATDTTYTAGTNVSISNENVISATDTTYSNFVGTDGSQAGTAGLVPAPATTDAGKFLKADGTWGSAGGGGIPIHTLTTDDLNWPTADPTEIRVDLLDMGWYQIPKGATPNLQLTYGASRSNIGNFGGDYPFYFFVAKNTATGYGGGQVTIYCFTDNQLKVVYVDGTGSPRNSTFSNNQALIRDDITNRLTSTSTTNPLSANQGKVLKDSLDGAIKNGGTTAPTTSTKGSVGTLYSYVDTGNNNTPHLLVCTDTTGGTYTWSQLI